jgi:hypothetical protein
LSSSIIEVPKHLRAANNARCEATRPKAGRKRYTGAWGRSSRNHVGRTRRSKDRAAPPMRPLSRAQWRTSCRCDFPGEWLRSRAQPRRRSPARLRIWRHRSSRVERSFRHRGRFCLSILAVAAGSWALAATTESIATIPITDNSANNICHAKNQRTEIRDRGTSLLNRRTTAAGFTKVV